MRGRIQKNILLPCLCCIAFYGGTQLVGETEAAFSSQVSPDSITVSAAFVFPSTIKQMEDRAQKIENSMDNNFKTIVTASPNASLEELHKKLAEVTAIEQELTRQLGTLHDLFEELSTYNMEIQNQGIRNVHTFDYVREGFQQVDRLVKVVHGKIDFSHIEDIRSSILLQIHALEKEPSMEHTQTNPHRENSETQDEALTSLNNDKQVTVYEEETMEHREECYGENFPYFSMFGSICCPFF
ncbi:DUF4047 domain-containing protein [Neobacillus niacini]|uniref:DUF4047 domain-containing protein n=1 Tax=Neobacillus niacini TaxID=86668 RepID=UPI002FFD7DCF